MGIWGATAKPPLSRARCGLSECRGSGWRSWLEGVGLPGFGWFGSLFGWEPGKTGARS